jgi:aspartate-semialdehyde dehydrogenase
MTAGWISMGYNVVIVGATGQVGSQVIKELEERAFPVKQLLAFASENSIAECVEFLDTEIAVQAVDESAFAGADIVFFCTPASVTREYLPHASGSGAFCIDLSYSAPEDGSVPCVVPELSSPSVLKALHTVANPPVAVIQMALMLHALHSAFELRHVCATVLQSASALGGKGVETLCKQSGALLNGRFSQSESPDSCVPVQLAYNMAPVNAGGRNFPGASHLGTALRAILGSDEIGLQIEMIQVPVFYANALSLACCTRTEIDEQQVEDLLRTCSGLKLIEPAQMDLCGSCTAPEDERIGVCVTRVEKGGYVNLWSVIDNLRKGSALNAVQIAEMYITG